MNTQRTACFATALVLALSASSALAHVSVTPTAPAGGRQVLTFGVGHGCEGADTVAVEIEIPEAVTSVRAAPSVWGEAELTYDDAELVTKVSWRKDEARSVDDQYYSFQLRISVPDAPFTTLVFKTTQTCIDAEGVESTHEWHATPEELASHGGDHGDLSPAPVVHVLPPMSPGWNEVTASADIADLSMFDGAEIVWVGDAAYSSNPTTMSMIEDDDSVEVLEEIAEGAEIWVKW